MTGARIENYGHRGARGLFPENTLEGFRAAWDLGIRAFELDVGMTADGVVVVSHDPMLNPDLTRDASGAWIPAPGKLIHAMVAAELGRYDVGRLRPGCRTALLFPAQAPRDGARIPTLAAVLAALPAARLILEVKTDPEHPDRTAPPAVLAESVLAVVDRAGAAGRVIVESFDWRVPLHIRRIRPDIRLAFLTRPDAPPDPWWAGMEPGDNGASIPAAVLAAAQAPAWSPIWAPAFAALTEAEVRQARAFGVDVIPWTVNREQDMRRLIQWGVSGIISDYPDVLAAVLAGAGSE